MDVIDKIWEETWMKVVKNSSYGSFSNTFTIWGTKRNELRKKKIKAILWTNKLKD